MTEHGNVNSKFFTFVGRMFNNRIFSGITYDLWGMSQNGHC